MAGIPSRRNTCGASCDLLKRKGHWAEYRARLREKKKCLPAERRCSSCRQTLPASAFGRNRARVDGLHHSCKACRAEYDRRPDQITINRRRKDAWHLAHREERRLANHVRYILRHEQINRKRRERYLFDLDYRARCNALNHARYHAAPQAAWERERERKARRQQWEQEARRRCFCGAALPGGEIEEGRWFCAPRCKIACANFVCGMDHHGSLTPSSCATYRPRPSTGDTP